MMDSRQELFRLLDILAQVISAVKVSSIDDLNERDRLTQAHNLANRFFQYALTMFHLCDDKNVENLPSFGDIKVGDPAGIEDDERLLNRELKLNMVIHAEQNALLIAGSRAKGASIYVWGKPICASCAIVIIQAGIERIIAMNPEDENKNSRWYKPGVLAIKMFKEVDKDIVYYQPH